MTQSSNTQLQASSVETHTQPPHVEAVANEASELVAAASKLLTKLGGDFSRVGWMLEDALEYLEAARTNEESVDERAALAEYERLEKLVQHG